MLRDQPPHHVDRPAGRKRHDELDDAIGVGLRRAGRNRRERGEHERGEESGDFDEQSGEAHDGMLDAERPRQCVIAR
jgi:hypothetical protein